MCLALSSVVGVWYLLRKVNGAELGTGLDWTLTHFRARWEFHVQWDPDLLFLSFSALDCQQSLWAGILPQRGGAAAPEQCQHWLHLAWGPLHLRCVLGKWEHSAGLGGKHVPDILPFWRHHAGWTHTSSQNFRFLSPEGCGSVDDRIHSSRMWLIKCGFFYSLS